jgi:endonuclease/exonuclease/phosphatase family metal-dependent hydrolase
MTENLKTMKVVVYNILFGMKGNNAIDMALSNLAMHGLRPVLPLGLIPGWLRNITVPMRNRFLSDAMHMAGQYAPDILCLNEVLLNTHKEELETALGKMGFTTIVYGKSKHHSPPFHISLLLATKAKAEEITFNMTMAPRPGGGGGAASIYIPENNLAVLGVHLALPGPVSDTEMKEINTWIESQKKLGRKMLIVGDFNIGKGEIDKKIPAFTALKETAFPTCPSFETFLKQSECVDHIFFDENFTVTGAGAERGLSDHKLVWSELTFK